MVGLIWMVQVVHYPMFDRVGAEEFVRYEADHCRLITPVVGLPMLVEMFTAIAILFFLWDREDFRVWLTLSLGLLIGIWLTTAFFSVPCHNKLAQGFNYESYRWLVATNWIRTALWTSRGLILAWLVHQLMSKGQS